jgi:signal transduction histidine kinase
LSLNWNSVRRFLTAEEVPRWFGLSVVLIYLVGLGAVARYGIGANRNEARTHYQQQTQAMVKLVGDRLEETLRLGLSDEAAVRRMRHVLRDLAMAVPGLRAAVVADGTVVASTQPSEEGTPRGDRISGSVDRFTVAVVSVAGSTAETATLRMQYPLSGMLSSDGEGATGQASFLDVVVPAERRLESSLARHAGTLSVVFVVLGSLFVVYRCLREQLRGARQIASRLAENRDCVAERLEVMSIPDARDAATAGWNELIELTRRLIQSADRNEATAELSEALERTSAGTVARALNAVPDGVVLLNEDGRIGFANAAACCLLGWDEGSSRLALPADLETSASGQEIWQLVDRSHRGDGCFEGMSEVVEIGSEDSSGGIILRVTICALRASSSPAGAVVMMRDVSQQVRAERSREEFVAQVAHELRTPLTNIRAYTETLSSGMFEDKAVITECYNVITKETRRLSRLVEDILSVSQLDLGSIEIRSEKVNLRRLLEEGVRDVRGMAEDKEMELQLVLPAKLEPIDGDRDKLAVVVNNLLGNAIKYTPKGGTIVVGCQVEREQVVVTVKDSGIGIDAVDHARIFQKFERGSGPEVEAQTGTGIGLFTAREIVRRHGGDIQLMSKLGNGSTFLVRLPAGSGRANVKSVSSTTEGGAS